VKDDEPYLAEFADQNRNGHTNANSKSNSNVTRDDDPGNYRIVRIGLGLIYYGSVVSLALLVLDLILARLYLGGLATPIYLVGIPAFGLGILVALVGVCMCLAAKRSNEKVLMILVLCILALCISSLAGMVYFAVMSQTNPALGEDYKLSITVSGFILFLSFATSTIYLAKFCKQVGINLNEQKLTRASNAGMVWVLITILICSALFFYSMVNPPMDEGRTAVSAGKLIRVLPSVLLLISFAKCLRAVRLAMNTISKCFL